MPRIYTTEIDGDEYIGESLVKINDNFAVLDMLQTSLSAVINEVNVEANLALSLVATSLTGVRDINLRLQNKGAFYTPHALYVSKQGDDTKDGTFDFPYFSLDKAINEITNVAKSSPQDPSTIKKVNDFYIIIKDSGVYALSSNVTFSNIPGNVHIVGATPSNILSAALIKPSTTFHDLFEQETNNNFVFDTAQAEDKIKDYNSFKVFQTFGKNVIPVPGYVNYFTGNSFAIGINNKNYYQFLSANPLLKDISNDRYYNYILAGNEIKEIQAVTNHNYFETTTPFSAPASGVPLLLGNKNNWHYTQIDNLQNLSAANNPNLLQSFDTEMVVVRGNNGSGGPPFGQGQTKFETSNVLFYNGGASLVVLAYPLSSQQNGYTSRIWLDNSGTLLTERHESKTPAPPSTPQGIVGYVPFFSKTFYELYRGVYDRLEYDSISVTASANNYERSTTNPKYNSLLRSIKMPRSFSVKMPTGATGSTYIQPLPTTIFFTNTASAGFKLIKTNLHLQNVYVRGPRVTANTTDIIDTRNIGVQAGDNSLAVIDSDCAIANFSIGVHAIDNSSLIIGGSNELGHAQNALSITDNSVGAIIENNSFLGTQGPRVIIAQNFQDGVVVRKGSKMHLQYLDVLHNGNTGIVINDSSSVGVGNICMIGNRYGIDCTQNSTVTISPRLLSNINPLATQHEYFSPNSIYCNGTLDVDAPAIRVAHNSGLVLEEVNLVKNSLSGSTIKLEDSSTGLIDSSNLFCTRNRSTANKNYSVGISTSNNSVTIKNTSIYDAQTAIKINDNANVTIQDILINRASVGLGLTNSTNTSITFTNYPSSNNIINSTDIAVYMQGSQNHLTSFGLYTNFRANSVIAVGLNNYGAMHTITEFKSFLDNFTVPAVNTLDSKDNKIRTASYPTFFPRTGQQPVFTITY